MEDAVIVEVANSLFRLIEETVMEDPVNVVTFRDEMTALDTYSFTTLLDVILNRYPLT
jgi:hypothetical protein